MRIAVSGIDGSGKSTLCELLRDWLLDDGYQAQIIGNLPRAYRRHHRGVIDCDDPHASSFFFNYALEHRGDPGSARFLFDPRYIDYLMAIEEVRLYHDAVRRGEASGSALLHDRHLLDRRVNAYRVIIQQVC